ncbi:hypothetical protein HYQ46_003552 [Verticillium longisporum]|nr:hypothetical protein HYQ46_003552 [Verticillium longisporum]
MATLRPSLKVGLRMVSPWAVTSISSREMVASFSNLDVFLLSLVLFFSESKAVGEGVLWRSAMPPGTSTTSVTTFSWMP